MPGYCIYFYSYFYLKPACVELGMNDQLACFMSGGLAGSLLWTLGMPGDTMKSKWQTDTGKNLKYGQLPLAPSGALGIDPFTWNRWKCALNIKFF